jgi:hypothetical protein
VKAKLSSFVIGLTALLTMTAFPARADLEVSASVSIHAAADFYAPLAPHGAWIEIGSYGRCWRPAGIAIGWRPYCEGHWVWTDCGWYWESAEPWAWACYHYGCWFYDPVQAWVWIPGIEWAPAWVSWRAGGDYIGWAPLPPRGVVVAGPEFVFVANARFQDAVRPSTVIVNNTTIISKTITINNTRRETRDFSGSGRREVVVNEGPGLDPVQRATGKTVKATPIQLAARQTRVPPDVGTKPAGSKSREQALPSEPRHVNPAPRPPGAFPGTRDQQQPVQRPPSSHEPPAQDQHHQPAPAPQHPGKPPVLGPDKDPHKRPDHQPDGHGKDKPAQPKEPKKDQ